MLQAQHDAEDSFDYTAAVTAHPGTETLRDALRFAQRLRLPLTSSNDISGLMEPTFG